ncbi:MAG: hypothetical protein QW548_01160 [Candidatus Aenigmatarchaeota archaeon]
MDELYESVGTLAKLARSELDRYFSFEPSSAIVVPTQSQGGEKLFRAYSKAYGIADGEADATWQRYKTGKIPGMSMSMFELTGGKCDYAVLVSLNEPKVMHAVLGEEIAHGEHLAYHVRRLGSKSAYNAAFSGAAIEFFGGLGFAIVTKTLPDVRRMRYQPDFSKRDIDGNDLDHFVGYAIAEQLTGESNVPYKEIYKADSGNSIWSLVMRAVRPQIRVSVSPANSASTVDLLERHCESIGLKAKITPVAL